MSCPTLNGRGWRRVDDKQTIESQVHIIIQALAGKHFTSESPVYRTAIGWIRNFPTYIDQGLKERLKHAACIAFDVSQAQLLAAIEGVPIPDAALPKPSGETAFRSILPTGGWFEWYDEYTRYNEAPLTYHTFAGLCILGAALGRRVWLSMGHFNIWPNYCVILVGPTGKVKKTTAADIAKDFISRHTLCPIMSDEPTPQALSSAMAKAGGHQFIYGGEMSVFFGKDKFKEAMIPKFLRMLDSPALFEVDTVTRGKETIYELAISFIGATTPSQFNTTMPSIVTSSGFMNRFVFVVENETERVFPRPWVGGTIRKLDETLKRFKHHKGVIDFAPGVEKGWWDHWYRKRKATIHGMTDDTMVEVMERLPGHLLRTAMLMHLVQCDNFLLCEKCLDASRKMLEYLDKNTPALVQGMKQSAVANDADFVLAKLIKLGGAADHSVLLRACSSRMNAQTFGGHIRTLEEQGKVKQGKRGYGQFYILIDEKEANLLPMEESKNGNSI